MSSSGGGGGGGGGGRVSIPENLRKTIQNIKEITGNQHSDEDVYAMLKECSMDPNETAQKLFYLDTFHEVKSKRDRRKESSSIKVPEPKSDARGRGARSGRGASSNFVSGSGRIMAAQRDNRANNFTEGGSQAAAVSQYKTKNNSAPLSKRALNIEPNGPSRLSNGVSITEEAPNVIIDAAVNVSGGKLPVELEKPGSTLVDPKDAAVWPITSLSEVRTEHAKTSPESHDLPSIAVSASAAPLSSDGGPTLLLNGQSATSVIHESVAGDANSMRSQKCLQKGDLTENSQILHSATPLSSLTDNGSFTIKPSSTKSAPTQEAADSSGAVVHVSDTVVASKVASITIEESCQPLSSSSVPDGQHVTFPNHFRVPEAFKNGLIFGSFNADFEEKAENTNGCAGNDKSSTVTETSQGSDEVAKESLPSEHVGDVSNNLQASNLGSVSSTLETSKQDVPLPPQDPNPVVQDIQTNHFGMISPIMGSQHVQLEVSEPQILDASRSSKIVNGNVPSLSSPSPSPSPSASPTPTPTVQTSVAVPLQPVPVFRQPYPLNYFPYGHYLPPFYMPAMHHLLSHNAFAQQPSSGGLYVSPAVAPPGVKIPFPAFKPAANTTPIGIPSGYGSYASIGYTTTPSVSSGTSSGNEDLVSAQLKENQIYSNPQLSEGSTLWIPPIGPDLTNLQVNSLYNLPQGQHVPFSPAPGAFGINQPSQSMASVPTIHSLLQQSQAGAVETVGLPSGAYQNPQHPQINWNTNF